MRLHEALALGALHGPAELLPVSSSAHTELIPALLGWEYAELEPDVRKAFEVALHAGTAAALLIALRDEVSEAVHGLDARRVVLLAGSFAPPAAAGLLLEKPIEEKLGTPRSIALGLALGALAMAAADAAGPRAAGGRRSRGPGRRGASRARRRHDANLADALALGVAQACALFPGVSRNGATLTAARLRGFARGDANALSRHVALPVIAGATLLKGVRLAQRGLPRRHRTGFAAGVGAAFASTLASRRLVRDDRALWPYAAYRLALAAWTTTRPWPTR